MKFAIKHMKGIRGIACILFCTVVLAGCTTYLPVVEKLDNKTIAESNTVHDQSYVYWLPKNLIVVTVTINKKVEKPGRVFLGKSGAVEKKISPETRAFVKQELGFSIPHAEKYIAGYEGTTTLSLEQIKCERKTVKDEDFVYYVDTNTAFSQDSSMILDFTKDGFLKTINSTATDKKTETAVAFTTAAIDTATAVIPFLGGSSLVKLANSKISGTQSLEKIDDRADSKVDPDVLLIVTVILSKQEELKNLINGAESIKKDAPQFYIDEYMANIENLRVEIGNLIELIKGTVKNTPSMFVFELDPKSLITTCKRNCQNSYEFELFKISNCVEGSQQAFIPMQEYKYMRSDDSVIIRDKDNTKTKGTTYCLKLSLAKQPATVIKSSNQSTKGSFCYRIPADLSVEIYTNNDYKDRRLLIEPMNFKISQLGPVRKIPYKFASNHTKLEMEFVEELGYPKKIGITNTGTDYAKGIDEISSSTTKLINSYSKETDPVNITKKQVDYLENLIKLRDYTEKLHK